MPALAENWWAFVVRGIFAILFGIAALAYPGLTLLILAIFFGAYVLVDGIVLLVQAFGNKSWLYGLGGVISVVAGLYAMTRPGITTLALVFLIGIWAMARGVVEIVTAVQLRKEIEGEFFLIIGGVVSILFGMFLVARPGGGALAVAWIIAFYAIVAGVLSMALGARLHGLKRKLEAGAAA